MIEKTSDIKTKYYKKRFRFSKKAISEMKKNNWPGALNLAKAKDKSIYDFIQWRHLLTKGNKASYYDYKSFIDKNENIQELVELNILQNINYLRMVAPNKIIDWFSASQPLSGFGKMILGESHILVGTKIEVSN